MPKEENTGILSRINGPVVFARDVHTASMRDQVEVGPDGLIGEIIGLDGGEATIQVYEDTVGLMPGMAVVSTQAPLSVELGPGLLGNVYDGIQRPLDALRAAAGDFIRKGVRVQALDRERKWSFVPKAHEGDRLTERAILGTVQETPLIEHRVMAPPGISGNLLWIAEEGALTVEAPIAQIGTERGTVAVSLLQKWPVRKSRPVLRRLPPNVPLFTGQRVLDFFFPLARGGAAAIPGGFGTGKTITQHQLAKWSDADIVLYIGCGERGNEMTQVLKEFPKLLDPKSNRPLMERTILIANTSNMPVSAREASIYTGITIAEYYRDMGYHVALMADSTSRWAEALREMSGRLEEMPAEEGYPAYLASRLAGFYERAGRAVVAEDGREGSVSIVGAVSPPGGDFSEPVTQHTRRFIRTFWGLDKELAGARHFPSVNWNLSYSEYAEELRPWWETHSELPWAALRTEAIHILREEHRLAHVVQLVGPDALPDRQRLYLEIAQMIKEAFLQQNAFDPIDAYCIPEKQLRMMNIILHFYKRAIEVLERGVPILTVMDTPLVESLVRMKNMIPDDELERIDKLLTEIDEYMDGI
ncbi:MAG: V-type ATP synthase subunit A [Candidatus Latescibacterota bacterium]